MRCVQYVIDSLLARTRACHIEQPSLFFDVGSAVQCSTVWKDSFLGTDDEHVAELETLGGVRRYEQDASARTRLHAVLILDQRHLRQVGSERSVLAHSVELIDRAHELSEVLASRLQFKVGFARLRPGTAREVRTMQTRGWQLLWQTRWTNRYVR